MNRTDTQIRQAKCHEAEVLSDIAFKSKQSNGYSDSFMDACREELTITTEEMSNGEYWVAEADVIQGFVCLTENSDQHTGEIRSFFIDPAWQRQGVGKLLWQKILERVKQKDIHTLYLDSDPNAVPFYQALGFSVTGEVPSGSIAGRTIPQMTFHIAPNC